VVFKIKFGDRKRVSENFSGDPIHVRLLSVIKTNPTLIVLGLCVLFLGMMESRVTEG
jgi:hypothetical protein